jgi:hypothetical protein
MNALRRRKPRPITPDGAERELAARWSDGLHIALLWHPKKKHVALSVADQDTGQCLTVRVDERRALEAFNNPLTYAL